MDAPRAAERLKVLVAIACYGERNLRCLQHLIATYRSMAMDVDIVVLTEAPKSVDLGPGVRMVIGTPVKNPWSLPFAHKQVFADGVDKHDLFIYTEDDIDVTEAHLRTFVQVTPLLAPDEIAGFIRYESAADGTRYVPDVHGTYRWLPESLKRRGEFLVGEYTNEHAAFYVITNDQLKKVLASGRFLGPPYEGRYDMLVSAATDIYVNYGFRKVVPVSHLEFFLVHHLTNRYVGQMGIPLSEFEEQIKTLTEIHDGHWPATRLCEVEPKALPIRCGKNYDEKPSADLLRSVPSDASTILSIGYGSGATERALQKRGAAITTFPLDSIVGGDAARHGMEVVQGTLDECFRAVEGRRFDCVVMTNLLHILPEPELVLERCARLVAPGGSLVVEGRNFDHLPTLIKRLARWGDYARLGDFGASGIHTNGPSTIDKVMKRAGFETSALTWCDRGWPTRLGSLAAYAGRFGARTWIVQARRSRQREVTENSRAGRPVQA